MEVHVLEEIIEIKDDEKAEITVTTTKGRSIGVPTTSRPERSAIGEESENTAPIAGLRL